MGKERFKRLKLKQKKAKIKLTEEQIDLLMELGNIGAGNAVTALSQLLNKTLDMSLSGVNLIPFNELSYILGDPNVKIFGILSDIKGKMDLSIIQLYTKESIVGLINSICETGTISSLENLNSIDDLSDEAKNLITEIGNIIAGAYCSALANQMSIKLIPDVPHLDLDALSSITNNLIKKYTKITSIVMINTKIQITSEKINLNGILCFIPSIKTLDKLFKLIRL